MEKIILTMTGRKFGCAFVVTANSEIAGIITDGDLRRNMGKNLMDKTAEQVMAKAPMVIRKTALAGEALAIMNDKKITCLPVVESPDSLKPVGIVHIHDILRAGLN